MPHEDGRGCCVGQWKKAGNARSCHSSLWFYTTYTDGHSNLFSQLHASVEYLLKFQFTWSASCCIKWQCGLTTFRVAGFFLLHYTAPSIIFMQHFRTPILVQIFSHSFPLIPFKFWPPIFRSPGILQARV